MRQRWARISSMALLCVGAFSYAFASGVREKERGLFLVIGTLLFVIAGIFAEKLFHGRPPKQPLRGTTDGLMEERAARAEEEALFDPYESEWQDFLESMEEEGEREGDHLWNPSFDDLPNEEVQKKIAKREWGSAE